mmetsp:Transcript_1800/g.3529  ORF Transcript_1800/g.3529 Transcript_1800/m.3529 type:complete len:349 (-) Transcript_1800:59-1105(-)
MNESPVVSRIPKTSVDNYTSNNAYNSSCNSMKVKAPSSSSFGKRPAPFVDDHNCDERVVIDLRSDESQEPIVAPARSCPPPTRQFIDLADDEPEADEDEIFVGTAEFSNFARDAYQRKKKRDKKARRESRTKKPHHHRSRNHRASDRSKSSGKYPRKCKIRGLKFRRKYHAVDKRYYYVQKGNEHTMSWNPWADCGEVAPWMAPGQKYWERGWDEHNNRFYYYSPMDKASQYERPNGYLSPQPIEYDSVDEERTPSAAASTTHPCAQPITSSRHNNNNNNNNKNNTAPPTQIAQPTHGGGSAYSPSAAPPPWQAPPRKKYRTSASSSSSSSYSLFPDLQLWTHFTAVI